MEKKVRAINIFITILMLFVVVVNVQAIFWAANAAQTFLFAMTATIFGICSFVLVRMEVLRSMEDRKEKKQ